MKKILLALACVLCFGTTYSQKNNSLLWAVSGNGLSAPSYLFGTYHFAGKSLIDSLAETKKYFNQCKTVVGEVIMDEEGMKKIAGAMMFTDGTTLDKLYTPEEYKLIGDYIKKVTNMDIAAVNTFKPATLMVMLMAYTAPKTFSETNPPVDIISRRKGND